MHLLLDGYNIIHAIPALERQLEQSLEKGRLALIAFCRDLTARRGDVRRITIVFDGSSKYNDLPPVSVPGIEVIFTDTGEDADRRILNLLEAMPSRDRAVVVSNDNYVFNNARVYRARAISVEAFRALAEGSGRLKKKSSPAEELPSREADAITNAYKKHLGLK